MEWGGEGGGNLLAQCRTPISARGGVLGLVFKIHAVSECFLKEVHWLQTSSPKL